MVKVWKQIALFVLLAACVEPRKSNSPQTRADCNRNEFLQDGRCQSCICTRGSGRPKGQHCGYGEGNRTCLPCVEGETYNPQEDPDRPEVKLHYCLPCRDCTKYNRETKFKCRPEINAECGNCSFGFYNSHEDATVDEFLFPCSACSQKPNHPQCATWLVEMERTKTADDKSFIQGQNIGLITLGVMCLGLIISLVICCILYRNLRKACGSNLSSGSAESQSSIPMQEKVDDKTGAKHFSVGQCCGVPAQTERDGENVDHGVKVMGDNNITTTHNNYVMLANETAQTRSPVEYPPAHVGPHIQANPKPGLSQCDQDTPTDDEEVDDSITSATSLLPRAQGNHGNSITRNQDKPDQKKTLPEKSLTLKLSPRAPPGGECSGLNNTQVTLRNFDMDVTDPKRCLDQKVNAIPKSPVTDTTVPPLRDLVPASSIDNNASVSDNNSIGQLSTLCIRGDPNQNNLGCSVIPPEELNSGLAQNILSNQLNSPVSITPTFEGTVGSSDSNMSSFTLGSDNSVQDSFVPTDMDSQISQPRQGVVLVDSGLPNPGTTISLATEPRPVSALAAERAAAPPRDPRYTNPAAPHSGLSSGLDIYGPGYSPPQTNPVLTLSSDSGIPPSRYSTPRPGQPVTANRATRNIGAHHGTPSSGPAPPPSRPALVHYRPLHANQNARWNQETRNPKQVDKENMERARQKIGDVRVESLTRAIKNDLALCLEDTTKGKKNIEDVANAFKINPHVANSLKTFDQLYEILKQKAETIAEFLRVLNDLGCHNSCNKLSLWILNTYHTGEENQTEADEAVSAPVPEEASLTQPIPETATPGKEAYG